MTDDASQVFYAYTYGSAGWLALQAVPLLVAPKVITTLLGADGHYTTDLEIYFARFLGLALVLVAVIMLLLTGSIPLTSTASEPVSMQDSDPKAPYAVPVLRLTMAFHALATIYCYTTYVSSSSSSLSLRQSGFMLGVVGYGALAAMGLWCVMFATSGGKISRRTGADKRTSGFPFRNERAYNKKVDKKKF